MYYWSTDGWLVLYLLYGCNSVVDFMLFANHERWQLGTFCKLIRCHQEVRIRPCWLGFIFFVMVPEGPAFFSKNLVFQWSSKVFIWSRYVFCYVSLIFVFISFSPKPTSPHRGWIIPPFGENPWWVYLAAAIPALLVTILIFMDQQITAVIVNRKEHKLKVGAWNRDESRSSWV